MQWYMILYAHEIFTISLYDSWSVIGSVLPHIRVVVARAFFLKGILLKDIVSQFSFSSGTIVTFVV